MENMDKGLTVPKWMLINWRKIPQMPQNLFAKIVCPRPKVWDFDVPEDCRQSERIGCTGF